MIIVSYYTKDTGYEEEVKNLIASCEKLDLQSDIVGIESLGKWDANCCFKPQFLLEKLKEHKQPIVWVDADAIFLKKPTLFETLKCDIALRTYDDLPVEHPSKIITGTLFLQNRPLVHELLKRWDVACKEMLKEGKEVWDQIALKKALLQGLSVDLLPLPDSYCYIYDKSLSPKEEAVILHYQASRLLKKVINNEVSPFWESTMFSQEKRHSFLS